MRPIETEYRGVLFRSRLEVRWAVFLDSIEVGWQYEQSWVPFGDASYTPDFWVDRWQAYAEVKPVWPAKLEVDKARAAADRTGFGTLLLIGPPRPDGFWAVRRGGETLVKIGRELEEVSMDKLTTAYDFDHEYLAAVDKAMVAMFDGYDDDRDAISGRYR